MQTHNSTSTKVMVVMASIVIILAGIKAASSMIVPFLLSLFIALACNPLINLGARYRVPRWLSVILVIFLILIFGFMLAGLVGQSMNDFSQSMPEYKEKLGSEFRWLAGQLANFNIHIDQQQLLSYLDPGMAMNLVSNLLSSLGSVMTNFFLILLTVVFMLFEAESIPRKVHIALDDPDMKTQQIDRFLLSVKNYLGIKTLVSLGTGLFIGVWLYFLGLNHYLLWAVLAFLLNYIPNIGSIIAAGPAVLLAVVQLGLGEAGLVALGYVTVNTLMGNVVEPRYMGRGLGLSTLVVFLSLIFWGWLLGTVGMLLSVPLTMIVKMALESSQGSSWLAKLLAGDDELKERDQAEEAESSKAQ